MRNQDWSQVWSQGSRVPKTLGSLGQTWDQEKSLKFILIDSIFLLYLVLTPEYPFGNVLPGFPLGKSNW